MNDTTHSVISNFLMHNGENEMTLTHYGVKGMRWGVRRSKPRSNVSTGNKPKTPGSNKSQDKKTPVARQRKRSLRKYTDADLSREVARLNMEKRFEGATKKPSALTKGNAKKMTDDEIKNALNRIRMEKELAASLNPHPLASRLIGRVLKTSEDIVFESAKAAVKPYVSNYFSAAIAKGLKVKTKKPEYDKNKD